MQPMNARRFGAAVAVATALLVAACGDSDSGDEAVGADQTDTTTTAAPSTTAAPGSTTAGGTEDMDDEGHRQGQDHDHGEEGHSHDEPREVAADSAPSLTLEVLADPMSGWNVHAVPTGLRVAPEHASTAHVEGEGHMHLYVDGEKVTRLYGEWYHLDGLDPGTHEIRVELSANDHRPLAVDGEVVAATATVEVAGDAGTGMDDMDETADEGHDGDEGDEGGAAGDHDGDEGGAAGDHGGDEGGAAGDHGGDEGGAAGDHDGPVIELAVGGEVARHAVSVGDHVVVVVTGETTDEVHVHGYDLLADIGPGAPATLMFTADIPGVFEIELEGSGTLLGELEVR